MEHKMGFRKFSTEKSLPPTLTRLSPPTHAARTFIDTKSSLLYNASRGVFKFSIKIISHVLASSSLNISLSLFISLSALGLPYTTCLGLELQQLQIPPHALLCFQCLSISGHSPFSPWLTLLAWGWSYNNSKSPPPYFP